jgi:hypothetical protein
MLNLEKRCLKSDDFVILNTKAYSTITTRPVPRCHVRTTPPDIHSV